MARLKDNDKADKEGIKSKRYAIPPMIYSSCMETKNKKIIFYDGECAMCHFSVSFAMARDVSKKLYFSPLNGETAEDVLGSTINEKFGDSIILASEGEIYTHSDAIIEILYHLTAPWPILGRLLFFVPKIMRDFLYKHIAATRKKYFQKPLDICPVLSPELRERFLK